MSFYSLLFISLLSGIIFHVEIVLGVGWAGTAWLSSPQRSIPISLGMYFIWLFANTNIHFLLRILFVGILIAILQYGGLQIISMVIVGGYLSPRIAKTIFTFDSAIFFLLPIYVMSVLCLITRPFKNIRYAYFLVSSILIYISVPFCMIVLSPIKQVYGQRIDNDFLHIIKTGLWLPFIIFALGFPYLFQRNSAITQPDR